MDHIVAFFLTLAWPSIAAYGVVRQLLSLKDVPWTAVATIAGIAFLVAIVLPFAGKSGPSSHSQNQETN